MPPPVGDRLPKVGITTRDDSSDGEDGMGTFAFPPPSESPSIRRSNTQPKGFSVSDSRLGVDSHLQSDGEVSASKSLKGSKLLSPTKILTSTSKSLIGHEKPIIIANPQIVEIRDFKPGEKYLVKICIRNIDSVSRRIRIIPPGTKYFAIRQEFSETIAPGLDYIVDVEFNPDVDDCDYHDRIIVMSNSEKLEIPLHSYMPSPCIEFAPQIDLGTVLMSNTCAASIELKNTGNRKGTYSFSWDPSFPIRIVPRTGTLQPAGKAGSKDTVKLEFTPVSLGIIRGLVHLEQMNQSCPRSFEVTASVVEQNLELIFSEGGGSLDNIHFGSLYYGQERTISCFLVNNSPQVASFAISIQEDAQTDRSRSSIELQSSIADEEVKERKSREKYHTTFFVHPAEGTIQPFSRLPLTIKFTPHAPEMNKGFQSMMKGVSNDSRFFSSIMAIEVVETGQKIESAISGKGFKAKVSCNERTFRFGECPLYDHLDIMFTLKNESDELPVDFVMSRIANFHMRPSQGRLLPLQSQNIIISFVPNQFGNFQSSIHISVCKGILGLPIHVEGVCSSMPEKRRHLVGGPNKVAEDFIPKLKMVESKEYTKPSSPLESKKRIEIWEQAEVSYNIASTTYALTFEQLKEKKKHEGKYNAFIRDNKGRVHDEEGGEFNTGKAYLDNVDIGISPGSGLLSPSPSLPKLADPLYLEHPYSKGNAADIDGQTGQRTVIKKSKAAYAHHDENVLVKKKFKPQPITNAEIRDCKSLLAPSDLLNVTTGHKSLDFGVVSIYSLNKKSFNVVNDLKQNIMVTIGPFENDELKQSTPESQVIPPGQMAGFDIAFSSTSIQTFVGTINYSINGQHFYKISISAEVIPAKLELSKQQMSFEFTADISQKFMVDTLVLSNPGNHPVDFAWLQSSNFVIEPTQGFVPAKGKFPINIYFHETSRASVEETLILKVKGGSEIQFPCIGRIPEAKCAFSEKTSDFGVLAVGLSREKTVFLRNTSRNDGFFYLENTVDCLSVSPDSGKVPGNGSVEIRLVLRPDATKTYDNSIMANIRGGKQVRLGIRAEADTPSVVIHEEEYSFGDVHIGSYETRSVSLQNNGSIPAVMYLDFTEHPDFHVAGDFDIIVDDDDANESPIFPVASIPNGPKAPKKSKHPLLYKIILEPSNSIEFQLKFEPLSVYSVSFQLPLKVMGMSSNLSLKRTVTATSIKPPLLVLDRVVDFKQKVLTKDAAKRITYNGGFTITNDSMDEVEFRVDPVDTLTEKTPFSLECTSGVLAPGESMTLKVFYRPEEPGTHFIQYNLFIGSLEKPYSCISCKGTATHSMLSFDRKEVILPVVPLGSKATATFYVINHGYDNLTLKYKTPLENKIPLQLDFPEGNTVNFAKVQLPVEVSVNSKRPLSYSVKIDFIDADGNRFPIIITGATDNSLFSLFPYYWSLSLSPEVPNSPSRSTAERSPDDMLGLLSYGWSVCSARHVKILEQRDFQSILRWINQYSPKHNVSKFPDDLVSSSGRALIDFVESVTAKPFPGKLVNNDGPKNELIMKKHRQYSDFLLLLKQHGGLLNRVRPEYLLKMEEYQRYLVMTRADNPQKIGSDRMQEFQAMDDWFTFLSQEAWMTVMCQVLKLFVINRITPSNFKTMPDVTKENMMEDPGIMGSGTQSVPESILLRWANIHLKKIFPDYEKSIVNFDTDFMDGIALSALLESHIPSLQPNLEDIIISCSSPEHYTHNSKKIVEAMVEVGLEYIPSPSEISDEPSRIGMVLLLSSLYHSLPQYVPKTTIEFSGKLHEKICKHLELTNPSGKMIIYQIRLDGSTDFSIESTSVTIPPKGTVSYPIFFSGRFSREVLARITFIPKRSNQSTHPILVFNLRSSIHSLRPMKMFNTDSRLYEAQRIDMEVFSPFPGNGRFSVSVVQTKLQAEKSKGATEAPTKKKEVTLPPPPAFFCKHYQIDLKDNQKHEIPIYFIPFQVGSYKCTVLFVDENLGEFCYEINASASLPAPMDTVKFSAKSQSTAEKECVVTHRNPHYEKAKSIITELMFAYFKEYMSKDANKDRSIKDRSKEKAMSKAQEEIQKHFPPNTTSTKYRIEYTAPFFSGPTDFEVAMPDERRDGKKRNDGEQNQGGNQHQSPVPKPHPSQPSNKVNITFNAGNPGQYNGKAVFKSQYDIRVYSLEGVATAPDRKAVIDFVVSARQSVVQEIPLANPTAEEWRIRVTLVGDHFHGPRDLVVHPNSSVNFPLIFRPPWICDVTGELVMTNASNGEKMIFTLHGIGEDPLAEDHVIIECQARWQVKRKFRVYNIRGRPTVFKVESDLAFVHGDSEVHTTPGQEAEYELTFAPQRAGVYHGSITFFAPDGVYIWYTIEVHVSPPPPEQVLQVSSTIRKPVIIEISISNPVNDRVLFEISMDDKELIGESFLVLEPNEVTSYEIIYLPLSAGSHETPVTFFNESVGQFWYLLKLQSEDCPPIELPQVVAEIGKSVESFVTIDNPLDEPVALQAESSNNRNFYLSRHEFNIAPCGSVRIPIAYRPSSIDQLESATVTFRSPKIGEYVYFCRGKGTHPKMMDEQIISSIVAQVSSSVVSFHNPFPHSVTVTVSLENNRSATFALLIKRVQNISVSAFGELQIPFSFTPERMAVYSAHIVIQLDDMKFIYPLKGLAEAPPNEKVHKFVTKSREKLQQHLQLILEGVHYDVTADHLSCEVLPSSEHQQVISTSVDVSIENCQQDGEKVYVDLTVLFEPLKPIKANCGFVISSVQGGRWRFRLFFESTFPDIDDVVPIEAALHKTGSVSFKLKNAFDSHANFQAYFLPGSPNEFSVYPSAGSLPPMNSTDAAMFIVSFTPHAYGKTLVGTLVIQTEETQWTYEIRGSHPQYEPPSPPAGHRIDNRLPTEVDQHLSSPIARRNFIQENIRKKHNRTSANSRIIFKV
eukprot:TRINITY_DN6284_c0_g1_i1.p1 TRINITY_DN6284_c0_g1~~TRINITY_DN6284_c0_g1_i1.p1  ORF type:complete len:2909 (+),score=517.05 TRINITY_DN6284_c0_g1_i1:178-8904(+)